MLEAWNTHTYAHCYLIIPISGYLIWLKRTSLNQITPQSEFYPIIFLIILCIGWEVGYVVDILALQEYSLVSFVPILVWILMGNKVFNQLLFPLWFLLFCVPFGDFLLPSMIEFTANFTVGMIELSGMPVYREGNHFSITSGDWSVVEACAGLRYLIASITLGTLYSYLNYTKIKYRIIFILFSFIVPIILNGIRAYLIVMIGHFSGMKLGVGADHFVYGWVFFGLGMALLFWLGSIWSDVEDKPPVKISNIDSIYIKDKWSTRRIIIASLLYVIIISIWPLKNLYSVQGDNGNINKHTFIQPTTKEPWRYSESFTRWKPLYYGATDEKILYFTDGEYKVGVIIEFYDTENQGSELVNSKNVLILEKDPVWTLLEESPKSIKYKDNPLAIMQGVLKSTDQTLLAWRFNYVSGKFTINKLESKLLKLNDILLNQQSINSAIILFTPLSNDITKSENRLQTFLSDMLPFIQQSIMLTNH